MTTTLSTAQQQAVNQLSQILNATQDLINHSSQIGKVAWQTTLEVTRIDVMQIFMTDLFLLGVSGVLAYLAYRLFKSEWYKHGSDLDFSLIMPWVMSFASIGLLFFALLDFFNIWNWIQLFHPALYLANEALNKITN